MAVRPPQFILVLLLLAAITGEGFQQSPPNRPWPPGVQKVPADSPPLSPEEALQTFYMPPGFRLELVAAEPLIQDPVAIDWDTQGRLWAVEMPGFMKDILASEERAPVGRVVVLQDTDGDGRMDSRTVFADRLVLARSLKVLDRGVLVGEPPNAWFMRDEDDDLRADTRELVTAEYGRLEVDPQNNANGFYWGLDNRMHTAGQSAIELGLKGGTWTVHRTLPRGEWGVSQDDAGRIYRNTNESALHVDLVPTPYYARHPNLLRTRGSYERLADDTNNLNIVWPIRPTPGTNRMYQAGIGRADGTLARFTSVCAPLVYRGHRLPVDLRGNVFVAEPAANMVSRIVLTDDGTTLRAQKAYDQGEFLASTDERFRPVYLSDAPDGTMYLVDMYRGIIEHRISITTYLRDQIRARKLEEPTGFGRIYRIVHEETSRDTSTALSSASGTALVEALSHRGGWWRDAAQRLIVERGDRSVVPDLVRLAAGAPDWRTRLHAVWTLDGLDEADPQTVIRALEDPSREVRVAAIRISERWYSDAEHPVTRAVLKRLDDEDWWVRHQLAASLGAMGAGPHEEAMTVLLERNGGNPVTLDAALSGLRGGEADVIARIMRGAGDATPAREAAIAMLAATIVRGAQDTANQELLAWIADGTRAGWMRSALLRGAEVALLGEPPPGAPPPRPPVTAGPVPCPTCPGGRAGPGGAYAFSRPEPLPTAASGRSGGRGGPGLRLRREPGPFAALGPQPGEMGARVTRVLARITWPGKPGEPAPVPPLNAEEQGRFDEGSEVYRNLCQACHQPDGRGQDRVAPSLVDSALVFAQAGIGVRILLHGKGGTTGLMPPVGGVLTDEQIAGVLTYIRREWGGTGSPVDPAVVARIRKATAARTRPWTEDELIALADSDPEQRPN
ncbi:hypothetical protein BH24ACI4_BH24ACI4_27120 [soil metagenome]